MKQYLDLLKRVLEFGDPQYNSRTGQLMILLPGDQCIYDLREGFPQCTTKPSVPIRWVAEEMFWMMRGERNAKTLYSTGVDIWNKNAFQHYLKRNNLEKEIPKNTESWNKKFESYQNRMANDPNFREEDADLGPIYGWQWRHWRKPIFVPGHSEGIEWVSDEWVMEEVDQIKDVLDGLKKDPGSRYHLFTGWNPSEIKDMALGPCHMVAHMTVTRDSDLDVHLFQRSCDVYLGVPFNIAQYSLLNHLFAQETGLTPRKFVHTLSNVHIYCGVPPRSNFLLENLNELQKKVSEVKNKEDYLEIRKWYLSSAPLEGPGNERKDHIPFVLEQLSKSPRELPKIEIAKMPFFDLITRPAKEVVKLHGYNPLKWDSKATMAA